MAIKPNESEIIFLDHSAEDICSFLCTLEYFQVSKVAFEKRGKKKEFRIRAVPSALVRVFSINVNLS